MEHIPPLHTRRTNTSSKAISKYCEYKPYLSLVKAMRCQNTHIKPSLHRARIYSYLVFLLHCFSLSHNLAQIGDSHSIGDDIACVTVAACLVTSGWRHADPACGAWPGTNSHVNNMARREDICRLTANDVPGAKLPHADLEKCLKYQLQRWLKCCGIKCSGNKPVLQER
jgi:hypothetical protein